MRVVVAGTRTYECFDTVRELLNNIDIDITTILSGHCKRYVDGKEILTPDRMGEIWASENNIPVELYPAEWDKYGRYAGPIRNKKMAELADYAVVFWDGQSRGSYSMIKEMNKLNKPILVHVYDWNKKG
jgi:hypothetical protein